MIAAMVGCTSSGKTAQSGGSNALSEALTRGVKFDKGLLKKGALPKSNAAGDKVRLLTDAVALSMAPGKASIMTLDADNPDEDKHPVAATLMQFEGSDSQIEVPVGSNTSRVDGGAGANALLHIENPFSVAKDICQFLCNQQLSSRITITVRLDNGGICQHQQQDLELDCTQDGDPKQCASTAGTGNHTTDAGSKRDAGAKTDAGSKTDAGTKTDAGSVVDGGMGGVSGSGGKGAGGATSGTGGTTSGTGGTSGTGALDAGSIGTAPQIGSITPANAPAGMAVTLSISGTGFIAGAAVYIDAVAVPTTFVSDTSLTAAIPAASTVDPGDHSIYVENTPGASITRSNVLYFKIDQVPGAPVVYDYSPDNGIAGDKILIIATNLAGQTLDIKDTNGTVLMPGTLSTISWPTAGTVDTVEVTLPATIATGPLTVANSLGSFKGKIFTVGSNLTRITGTVLDSSTEFNTSNWARASGGDNLLATSFFTAHGDCASMTSCTIKPWFKITFPSAQTVARIAMRGNREYASGYDFLNGKFEVLGVADAVLWEGTYDLPAPDRDLDLTLQAPVPNALSVRFTGLADESDEPGFSELEVFGP